MAHTEPLDAQVAGANRMLPVEARRFEVAQQQPMELTVADVVAQKRKIQEIMGAVMKPDVHYGVIPGTGTKDKPAKPTLYQAGAQTLCFMFRLNPSFEVVDKTDTIDKIAYTVRCKITHIPTGDAIAEGLGHCNSREAKYLRDAPKKCPVCGKEAIIKGKEEYGGGWLCYKKKQGCGAKWDDGDPAIEEQPTAPADPADLHNTILKMANKRAMTAAVLNGTAASDFFTQDLEDLPAATAAAPPVSSAPETVKQATVLEGAPRPAEEVVTAVIKTFAEKHGVAVSDLEARLGRVCQDWTTLDIQTLRAVFAALRDGKSTVVAEFGADQAPPPAAKSATDALADKVAGKKAAPRTVNAEQDPSQAPVDYDQVPF